MVGAGLQPDRQARGAGHRTRECRVDPRADGASASRRHPPPRRRLMPLLATFDCYGTLVDWEGGAAAFLYDLALRNGDAEPPPGRELRDRWEELQFGLLRGEYRPYREVLAESLRAWMEERGYPWRAEEGEALLRSMRSWQPFPDTRPALLKAREAGMRLAIVSNTDRDIIAHTVRHIGIEFDAVITAEDARAYKPA